MENEYIPNLGRYLRLLPEGAKEKKPDAKRLADLAFRAAEQCYDYERNPEGVLAVLGQLSSHGITDPETQARTIVEGLRNTKIILLSEIAALRDGACLHVPDRDLVEALAHSDIEAAAGDARLPFPIMEIRYPEGVELPGGVQASGTIILRFDDDFKRRFKGPVDFLPCGPDEPQAKFLCVTRMRRLNGSYDGQETLISRFDETLDLLKGVHQPDLSQSEREGLNAHVRLAWALFLYIQSARDQAVRPDPKASRRVQGVPGKIAATFKNRSHYSVTDILGKSAPKPAASGGVHASPRVHWRIGHIRVLKDQRYQRNPDGSLRAVWVRPAKIGEGDAVSHKAVGA